jgi:predicted Rossmann-fold nucleotide-binding protein
MSSAFSSVPQPGQRNPRTKRTARSLEKQNVVAKGGGFGLMGMGIHSRAWRCLSLRITARASNAFFASAVNKSLIKQHFLFLCCVGTSQVSRQMKPEGRAQ